MDTRLAVRLANPRARQRMNGFGFSIVGTASTTIPPSKTAAPAPVPVVPVAPVLGVKTVATKVAAQAAATDTAAQAAKDAQAAANAQAAAQVAAQVAAQAAADAANIMVINGVTVDARLDPADFIADLRMFTAAELATIKSTSDAASGASNNPDLSWSFFITAVRNAAQQKAAINIDNSSEPAPPGSFTDPTVGPTQAEIQALLDAQAAASSMSPTVMAVLGVGAALILLKLLK